MNTRSQNELLHRLQAITFFRDLPVELLLGLCQGALWIDYMPGEVVFLEGERLPGLHLIEHGWLKVVKSSPDGREQVLRFIGPGETFNEIGVFANRPNPATGIALEQTGMWLLRREAIHQLLLEKPEFAQYIIEAMADRIIDLVGMVADLSLRPVAGRLARLILQDSQDDILHRPRWYTQTELAARVGTVPDVVQRALRALEDEGLIELDRHQIRIRDRSALEKLIS
jgi:CRP/FNR family transcriptional regulator